MTTIRVRQYLSAAVLTVAVTACGSANTADLVEGSSGLSGAIPGGDGRALAAYKAEFTANAVAGMDTLMLRLSDLWQRDDRDELATLYDERVTFVTPDGELLVGGDAVREYVSWQLPRTSSLDTWRDDFAASGLMTFMYGRYDADSNQPGGDHRGVHVTVAKRDRFTWKIRSKMYLSFDGSGLPTETSLLSPEPPHVTPDSLRAVFGPRALNGQNERAEWIVDSYYFANSFLGRWRFAWNNDDFTTLASMMSRGVVVRLPYDIPAVGRTNAGYSLQRLLPAVGELSMSILDFDMSERISFCLGRYALNAAGQNLNGYYLAVVQLQDDGPELRALLFSHAGANQVLTEGG